MDLKKVVSVALFLGIGLSSTACSTNYLVDRTLGRSMDRATDRVSNEIGNRLGDAIAAHMLSKLGPEMMRQYSLSLFQILFYQGGIPFSFLVMSPVTIPAGMPRVWHKVTGLRSHYSSARRMARSGGGWSHVGRMMMASLLN